MKMTKCSNQKCILFNKIMMDESVCPICGSAMQEESEKYWLESISEDKEAWVEDADKVYPCIIAANYQRLHDLCKRNDPYGVLLCLKENFECLLKYTVLIEYAWAKANMDEEFEKSVISKITEPNPSFGTWQRFGMDVFKELKAHGKELPKEVPFETVDSFFDKNKIVSWRNDTIGHGVMSFEEDEDFQKDIKEKIFSLKKLFTKIHSCLIEQKMYFDNGTEKIFLMGADALNKLNAKEEVYIKIGNEDILAAPFITVDSSKKGDYVLFFFDSQKKPTLSVFHASANGLKDSWNEEYFANLWKEFVERNKGQNIDYELSTDDRYKSADEYRELDLQIKEKEFVKPVHLCSWLRECITNYDKGVFLLRMSRGMGKSVFAEKINNLFNKPYIIDEDLQVRTYHLGRTQMGGTGDMETYVEYLWKKDSDVSMYPGLKNLSEIDQKEDDPAKAFAAFLGDALELRKSKQTASKIMMVFDGLDETISEEVIRRFPTEEMLNDGVYILFTSRDEEVEDISPRALKTIGEMKFTEEKTVRSDSEENRDFLRGYINGMSIEGLTAEKREALIDKAHEKVLDLGILCKLLKKGISINDLDVNETIVGKYLEILVDSYGDKGSEIVKEILAIISVIGDMEPITLRQIGEISSENKVSLRLAGIINDIAPLLNIERVEQVIWQENEAGEDEEIVEIVNTYRIANPDLSAELKKQIPHIEATIRDAVELGKAVIQDVRLPELYSGDELVCIHLYDLVSILPEKTDALSDDDIKSFKEFCIKYQYFISNSVETEHLAKLLWQNYLLFKEKFGEAHVDTLGCLNDFAVALSDMGRYDNAIIIQEEVYKGAVALLGEYHVKTLTALRNLSNTMCRVGNYSKAKELQEELYNKSKEIKGEEDVGTLSAYSQMAMTISEMGDYKKARDMLETVYNKMVDEYGETHPTTLQILGDYAWILQKLGDYRSAREYQEVVYNEFKTSLGKNALNTILASSYLAYTMQLLGEYKEAKDIQTDVLNKLETINGKNHPDTINALNNLSMTLSEMGDLDSAYEYQKEAYYRQKEQLGDYHPDTLHALNNLGITLSNLGKYKESRECAEEVYKKRLEKFGENNSVTVEALYNLATAVAKDGELIEAKKLYEKCYGKRLDIDGANHPYTIKALSSLANVISELGEYKKAKELQEEVYNILVNNMGKDHVDTISALYSLGLTLRGLGEKEESYKKLEEAYNEYLATLGPDNPHTIMAQSTLAEVIMDFGEFEKAKDMQGDVYRKSLEIWDEYNPITIDYLNKYIVATVLYGDFEKGCELYEKLYEIFKLKYGEEDLQTIKIYDELASLTRECGNIRKAYEMYKKLNKLQHKVLKADDPDIKRSYEIILTLRDKLNSK